MQDKLGNEKLSARKLVLISCTLFSLFFGAGNLIFPPFLGQNAGSQTPLALLGFLLTAVVMPILAVIVIAKFNGLDNLGKLVNDKFAIVFAVIIYISIGPGLAIPRAGSVPFEMAIVPYLPQNTNPKIWMAVYSTVFFLIALWLCLTPGKLVNRIGSILMPTLLTLICVLFVGFLVKGEKLVVPPTGSYEENAFMQGFVDGYQTMDVLAGLNFGLVMVTTMSMFGITKKKTVIKNTIYSGLISGSILAFVYFMIAFIGAKSSGVYPADGNGAILLRKVVEQIFGIPGVILLAAIFTIACLTACVGLINSISQYFNKLFPKVSYKMWAVIIVVCSFLICNLGLNAILKISIPVLNIVYPIAIMLVFLGLTNKLFDRFSLVYKITIATTFIVSFIHVLSTIFNFGSFGDFLNNLPLFKMGFFWVIVDSIVIAITMLGYLIYYLTHKDKWQKFSLSEDKESEENIFKSSEN